VPLSNGLALVPITPWPKYPPAIVRRADSARQIPPSTNRKATSALRGHSPRHSSICSRVVHRRSRHRQRKNFPNARYPQDPDAAALRSRRITSLMALNPSTSPWSQARRHFLQTSLCHRPTAGCWRHRGREQTDRSRRWSFEAAPAAIPILRSPVDAASRRGTHTRHAQAGKRFLNCAGSAHAHAALDHQETCWPPAQIGSAARPLWPAPTTMTSHVLAAKSRRGTGNSEFRLTLRR